MGRRPGLAVALVLAFVLSAGAGLAEEVTVQVGHNRLEPTEVKIPVGSTVVFHNLDEMPGGHTIVADDGSFQSPGLAKDEKWSHTFTKPGVYPYSIKQHPSAKARIVVE